jgi:uncharacterized OB-fold protein
MGATTYSKPRPRIDTLNKPFWDSARENRLVVHYCTAGGDTRFPLSPACPKCLSPDQARKEESGRGTLQSWIDCGKVVFDPVSAG